MSDENQYSEQAQQAQHLQYTPESQEDARTETEVEAATTQAVVFDLFADEDDEQEPGTAAVASDPSVDDDDDDEESDIAELLGRRSLSSSVTAHPGTQTPDPSMASYRKALGDFRRRRLDAHCGRTVTNGMAHLPYITTQDPRDAIMNDEKIQAMNKLAPSLKIDGTVTDRYEIVGLIARDGLGWIYLAIDHNVSDRWVVSRGIMVAKNEKDFVVIQTEHEFLAKISHLGIMRIINFIDETDANRVTGPIVMKYVGDPSLCKQRRSYPNDVVPYDLAIGYILKLLPTLDYLHSCGVIYNDLKPDDVLLNEGRVALIDIGAVTDIGTYGHIYGTPGFQAPETAATGPAIANDICTAGRTLTSLILKLPAINDVYDPGLPSPVEEPLFRRFYPLYRFLLRACHESSETCFSSAEEMSVQLIGVLHEILAIRDGAWFPQTVSNFSPQHSMYGTKHLVFHTDRLIDGTARGVEVTPQEVIFALPVLLVNPTDPGARILSASPFTEPNELIEILTNALSKPEYGSSMEIPLGIVCAKLDLGLIDEARDSLCDVSEHLQCDWRHHWYKDVTCSLLNQFNDALASFRHMLTMLPDEPVPKLALATTLELIQQRLDIANASLLEPAVVRAAANLSSALGDVAADTSEIFSPAQASESLLPQTIRFSTLCLYAVVWAANPATVSSAFGLARQLVSERQHEMAISQLGRVPGNSHHHRMACLATISMLTSGVPSELTESRIRRAARRLVELPTNEPRMPQLHIAVMVSALNWLHSSNLDHTASSNGLLDTPFIVASLRERLEKDLRMLTRSSQFPRYRYSLVGITNLIRPRTWR